MAVGSGRQAGQRIAGNPLLFKAVWNGTVLEGKRDFTGTYFRRNRYLDPATGQFTQEDPIGIAGGLNLYGYAGGDPINFSDPFGLKITWVGENQDELKERWANSRSLATDALGSDDADVRSAARLTLALMDQLENPDTEEVYIGYANIFDRGLSSRDEGTNHLGIQIGRLFPGNALNQSLTLVHESGHVSQMMQGFAGRSPRSVRVGLLADNAFRMIVGCSPVPTHEATRQLCIPR